MSWCEKETHSSGVYNLQCKLYPDSDSGNKDYVILKDFQSQKKYIDDLLLKESKKSVILTSFETIGNQMKAETLHYLMNNQIDLIFYKLISNYRNKKIEFKDNSRIIMDESEKQKALSKNAYYFLRIENSTKEDIKRGLQKALSEDDLYILEEYQTWYNYLEPKNIITLLTKKDEDGEFLELYMEDAYYNLSVIKEIVKSDNVLFTIAHKNVLLDAFSNGKFVGNNKEIAEFLLDYLDVDNKTLMDYPKIFDYISKERKDELIGDMVTIKTAYKSTLYKIFKNPKYKKEKKRLILKLLGLGKRNELLETIYNTTEINSNSKIKFLPLLLSKSFLSATVELKFVDDEIYERYILKFVNPFKSQSTQKDLKLYYYSNNAFRHFINYFKHVNKNKNKLNYYDFENPNFYERTDKIFSKNNETK